MYSAQILGISLHAEDFVGEGFIEALATDIAQRQQNWGPLDQLAGEDVALLSKTLAGIRFPPISGAQKGLVDYIRGFHGCR